MTDDEINGAIATHYDDFKDLERGFWDTDTGFTVHPNGILHGTYRTGVRAGIPDYLHDVRILMPIIEKAFIAFQWNPHDRAFSYLPHYDPDVATRWRGTFGSTPLENGAFCRAACLALIEAAKPLDKVPVV